MEGGGRQAREAKRERHRSRQDHKERRGAGVFRGTKGGKRGEQAGKLTGRPGAPQLRIQPDHPDTVFDTEASTQPQAHTFQGPPGTGVQMGPSRALHGQKHLHKHLGWGSCTHTGPSQASHHDLTHTLGSHTSLQQAERIHRESQVFKISQIKLL